MYENYIVKNGDKINKTEKKIENAILDILPKIIFENEIFLVVNKPPD